MRKNLNCGQQRPLRQDDATATTHLTASNIRRAHPDVRQPPLGMRGEGSAHARAHTRAHRGGSSSKQAELDPGTRQRPVELRGDVSHGRKWRSRTTPLEKLLLPLCLLAALGAWRGPDAAGGGRTYGVHAHLRAKTMRGEAARSPGCHARHF